MLKFVFWGRLLEVSFICGYPAFSNGSFTRNYGLSSVFHHFLDPSPGLTGNGYAYIYDYIYIYTRWCPIVS